jgi:hypothetical protein
MSIQVFALSTGVRGAFFSLIFKTIFTLMILKHCKLAFADAGIQYEHN